MSRRLVLAIATIAACLSASPAFAANNYCVDTADNVVVYVDKTTPYDDKDKTALVDGIDRLFESLRGGERFTIRTIAESYTSSVTLLDACAPFCPDAGFLGDLFGSCTEGVMLNDRKRLREQVVQQLKALLGNFVELPNSEIVGTIARTAPEELRPGHRSRFFLFTDLIENSVYLPGKQFFSDKNDALLKRLAADGLVPDLGGADVLVFGVGRGGNPTDRHPLDQKLLEKLMGFWQAYFAAAHASVSIQQSLGTVS